MKRTLTNIIFFVFFSFLLIGIICALQNVIQDIQRTFSPSPPEQRHILAYPL